MWGGQSKDCLLLLLLENPALYAGFRERYELSEFRLSYFTVKALLTSVSVWSVSVAITR